MNKIKIKAIVDSGAPCRTLSSKLVKKLGLQPGINHRKDYGTTDIEKVRSLGAYSALPMKFRKLFVSAPVIVLPNCNYDMLLGTSFLLKFGIVTDFKKKTLEILGQKFLLYYSLSGQSPPPSKKFINLEYADGIIPIPYSTRKKKTLDLPESILANKVIPLRVDSFFNIPSHSQQISHTEISIDIPKGMHGIIISPLKASRHEPLAAPGIILPEHKEISVLLDNLQNHKTLYNLTKLLVINILKKTRILPISRPWVPYLILASLNLLSMPSILEMI